MLARPEPVCDVLEHTEYDAIVKLFGENVYQEMIGALVNYSAATVWSDETDYVLNDLVIYEGVVYKLIVANSSSVDTPNCNSEWIVAPKFTKACFNSMWTDGGLKKLLSWKIFAAAVPFYPNILGATDFQGEDSKYKEKINFYLSNIYTNISRMEKQLFRWNEINKCVTIALCTDQKTEQNQVPRQIAW